VFPEVSPGARHFCRTAPRKRPVLTNWGTRMVQRSAPSRAVSAWDRLRYRSRLVWLALSLKSRPSVRELVGYLGLSAVVAAGVRFLVGLGPLLGTAIAALATVGVLMIAVWRIGRIAHVFSKAKESERGQDRLLGILAVGMRNADAYRTLGRVYEPVLVAANADLEAKGTLRRFRWLTTGGADVTYCAAVLPALPSESLDSLLSPTIMSRSPEWSQRVSHFAQPRQDWMKALRGKESHTHPLGHDDEAGDNLALDQILVDAASGDVSLIVTGAAYGQIVRTGDSLINEFAVFAYLCQARRQPEWLRWFRVGRAIELQPHHVMAELPWRQLVHSWEPDAAALLLRPRGRAAGIGVAVTTVERRGSDDVAFVGRRSTRVGTYPGAWHVIPAGMCNAPGLENMQRLGQGLRRDLLRWTMLSELLEECFDLDEFSDARTDHWRHRIDRECRNRGIDTAQMTFTGLAFDFLNLRLEVCARITLDSALVKTICWEYDKLDGLQPVPLADAGTFCRPEGFVQSGVASLVLAATGQTAPSAHKEGR
jgi:hypothetical protein